jgi:6-pyruvoyltetrahydropterin/6-carboxytetrahydropterin synthase
VRTTITVERSISMGHRLPSYNGICSSPHGHNIRVVVQIDTDDFLDFKVVDGLLRDVLEDFDHAMVLWNDDPLLPVLREMKFRTVAMNVEPTTENVAALFFNELLESGLYISRVTVHETDKYSAFAEKRMPTIRRVL